MEYKLVKADEADMPALEKLDGLLWAFEAAIDNVMRVSNPPPPEGMVESLGSFYEAMDTEHPGWGDDASLDLVAGARVFDIGLGYVFKAAAAHGLTDQITNSVPAEISSETNKALYEKYELPSLAMAARLPR